MSRNREIFMIHCDDGHDQFVVDRLIRQSNVWVGMAGRAGSVYDIYADERPDLHPLQRMMLGADDGPPDRQRWEFRCSMPLPTGRLCGRNVPARDEVLQRAVSKLYDAGKHEISLALLDVALTSPAKRQ